MTSEQAGAALSELTKEGIGKLRDQLASDLGTVMALNASDAVKQDLQDRIGQLRFNLLIAFNDGEGLDTWVVELAPQFKLLTAKLAEALGASLGPTGSCAYVGGCIQSTKAQCDNLGGSFTAGAACP